MIMRLTVNSAGYLEDFMSEGYAPYSNEIRQIFTIRKLGRPSTESMSREERRIEYAVTIDRIEVERSFSLSKRCYSLGLIRTKTEFIGQLPAEIPAGDGRKSAVPRRSIYSADTTYLNKMPAEEAGRFYAGWKKAVAKVLKTP